MKKMTFLLAAVLMTGCSNSKDASESNFKAALQEYYDQKPACLDLSITFPYEESKNSYFLMKNEKVLNELVNLGFLTVEETEVESRYNMYGKKSPEEALKYDLTDQGRKQANLSDEHNQNFCYGNYEVVDVKNFTEPTDMMGETVARVNFSFKLTNVDDWAKESPVFKEQLIGVKRSFLALDKPIDSKAELILTNKGWMHERLFSNS